MASSYLPPGFRFHPTDGELVLYYLKRKISGKPVFKAIAEIDIYKSSPWDLPGKSLLKTKDLEWYFFCPRDRKYASGPRTNRSTENGYWKTTGKDRPVRHSAKVVGMKKTLVFHIGKPPAGERTNWVMHEYRLEEKGSSIPRTAQDAFVLCRVFEKSGPGPKNGEQYGAPIKEEDWDGEESCLVLPQTVSSPGADDALNEDAVCLPGSHDPTNQIESQELLPSNNIPVESDELQRILLQFDVEGDFVIPSGNCDGQFVEEKDKTNCMIASGNCDGQLVEEKDVNCNQGLVGSTSKVEQVGSNIFDGLEDITYTGRFDRGDVAGSFFKGFEDDQLFDVFQEGSYMELNDLLIQPPEGIAPNFQRGSSSEFNGTSCIFTASGSRAVMTPRELFGPTIPERPTPLKVSDIDLYEIKTSDINISGSIGDTYFMSPSSNSALTASEAPLTSALTASEAPLTSASSARRYSYAKSDVPFLSDGRISQAANPFEPSGREGGLAMQDLSGSLWQDAVEDENTNDPQDAYVGMDDYVGWNS